MLAGYRATVVMQTLGEFPELGRQGDKMKKEEFEEIENGEVASQKYLLEGVDFANIRQKERELIQIERVRLSSPTLPT